MTRVRSNIVANIAGQASNVVLALVCTPFYIKLLGVEAYGLIAFFLTVQLLMQALDLGLGGVVNREMARSLAAPPPDLATFVRTLEGWYWMLGLMLGMLAYLALPAISSAWLKPEGVQHVQIEAAARVFSALVALQWPLSFYVNAVSGLQKQVAVNTIQIPFSIVASVGGLLFIWLGPRSVAWLFAWQACVSLAGLLFMRGYFWQHAPVERSGAVRDARVLLRHWRLALGMNGIAVTGLLITHLDKIILSRLLPLESFAHYSLAVTVARGLYVFISPVFSAYLPRLSALVARGDAPSLRHCYHTATQTMAVMIVPLALVLALYARDVMELWLRNSPLAASVAPLAALLLIGTFFNGLMNVPFALQLACGNTRIGLVTNLVLVALLVPTLIVVATRFGALGAAAMWPVANALYLAAALPITHRSLLGGELGRWASDIMPSLLGAGAIVGASLLVTPQSLPAAYRVLFLIAVWAIGTAVAAVLSPATRAVAASALRSLSARAP